MITRFPIEDTVLISHLYKCYSIDIDRIDFIPVGDSAYSYRVNCINEQKYYLKIFDHQNERQKTGVTKLAYYLPLTWHLYHHGVFQNITYPMKNNNGEYCTVFDQFTAVLFNYIEGETLADAHPFSDLILKEVAESMALIHLVTPKADLSAIPKETLDVSFCVNLQESMVTLENLSTHANSILLAVKENVFERKELIITLMSFVTELSKNITLNPNKFVLCHGDVWGGNLIRHGHELHFIDWESVIAGPPEYNFFVYIGPGFEVFYTSYVKQLGKPIPLNLDLLRFYSYRTHLRNLTYWLVSILKGNNSEEQNLNDLDMIINHCLNRFDPIATNIMSVEEFLKNTDH